MNSADDIMYQAGRKAHRDGAPAPGEYCIEGYAYRAGWYDAEKDKDKQPYFRIVERTYSGNAEPLVEVLLMLYDWSIERQVQERLAIEKSAEAVEPPDA